MTSTANFSPVRRQVSGSSSTASLTFRDKVARALSPRRGSDVGMIYEEGQSLTGALERERSRSRGREVVSTGRGGAGNMTSSPHRGEDVEAGYERGREIRDKSVDRVTHSGRGGAGNIRSPSRQREQAAPILEDEDEALQEKLIAERRGREQDLPVSTGRGGAGNMGNSRSRSRSRLGRGADVETGKNQASGRGGWGNIQEQHGEEDLHKMAAEQRYEQEVLAKYREGGVGVLRTGGRGGAGNVEVTEPLSAAEFAKLSVEEKDAHLKMHTGHGVSTGKGGFGNIQEDGGRGRDQHKGGVLGNVFRSLSRAASGGRESSRESKKETA